jgi:hypothetical protein
MFSERVPADIEEIAEDMITTAELITVSSVAQMSAPVRLHVVARACQPPFLEARSFVYFFRLDGIAIASDRPLFIVAFVQCSAFVTCRNYSHRAGSCALSFFLLIIRWARGTARLARLARCRCCRACCSIQAIC